MQINNRDKTERILANALPCYFFIVFVIISAGALKGYIEHHGWKVGDWLINYQGGIVRRGLLGELCYQFSLLTSLNPGVFALACQIACYGAFFFFSFLILRKKSSLKLYLPLIASPFIFKHELHDYAGGYRKEIIFFAIIAFISWAAKVMKQSKFKAVFYVVLLLYPAVVLTHEMLAVYLPYLLIVYLSNKKYNYRDIRELSFLLLPSLACFVVSCTFAGTEMQTESIFTSLSKAGYQISGGAIEALSNTPAYGNNEVANKIRHSNYLITYPTLILFASVAFIPVRRQLRYIKNDRLLSSLLLITVIGSIPLFAIAIDWGRFIRIHLVALCFLALSSNNGSKYTSRFSSLLTINTEAPFSRHLLKYGLIAALAIYSMLWRLPHLIR